MLIVATYLSGALLFFGMGWAVANKHLASNLVNPIVAFCIIYGLGYFIFPAWAVATDTYLWEAGGYAEETMILAWPGFVLFGLATVLTFRGLGGNGYYRRYRGILYNASEWRGLDRSAVVVFGIVLLGPAIVAMFWLWQRIGRYGYSAYMADRIIINSGSGFVLTTLQWALLFLIYFYAYHLARGRYGSVPLRKLGLLLLLGIAAAPGLLRGSRSGVLIPLLFLFVSYTLLSGRGRMSTRRVVTVSAVIAVLVLVGILLNPIRRQVSRGEEIRFEMVETTDVSRGLMATYGGYERVWWLMENLTPADRLNGKTFIAAAVGFVPRRLWAEKPLGGGPHFRNMMHPGSYDLQRGRNISSYTTGLPTEAYMNFGYLGLLAVGVGYGVIIWGIAFIGGYVRGPAGFTLWLMTAYIVLLMGFGEFFGSVAKIFSTAVAIAGAQGVYLLLSRATRHPGRRRRALETHGDTLMNQSTLIYTGSAQPLRNDA